MIGGLMEVKKILVLGESSSGKKTALEQVCSDLVKTESASYGKTIIENKKLQIFSPSGAERFNFMKDVLSKNMDGAIIFVDNTKGITKSCEEMIDFVEERGVPYVLFTNKQDLNESPIFINKNVPIIPTIALNGTGILHGFKTLVGLMNENKTKREIEIVSC